MARARLNEPSVVAIRQKAVPTGKSDSEVGLAAKQMLGRTPGNITAIRPMKDGVIADFTVTEQMLKQFIKVLDSRFRRPHHHLRSLRVHAGRAARDPRAALGAGASKVYLIEEPMAAAIGADLPISDRFDGRRHRRRHHRGRRDLLGGMVYSGSARAGGDKPDEAIVNYIRRNYGC
jgi:rod shape-determining protein MreB